MKLIEALKHLKDLKRKADDYCQLVKDHCAISNLDTPKYPDQKAKVDGWIQGHSDILREIMRLRVAVQKTNLQTSVAITIGDKTVTKTIAEWIHRRRDLADSELAMWNGITDRGVKEGMVQGPTGQPVQITVTRFYDPGKREDMRQELASEPSIIDANLEIANAITDLIE